MANALKGFVENEGKGCLPLMGSIPDMTASTQTYIGLQKMYVVIYNG
jgi:amyloid beta precursor protein binding protein 1